jgi:hypothetical protein
MDYPLLVRMPDGRVREAASPAVTASAGPVIARRSATCGADCLAGPCTLGQMRAAQRAAVTDPRITLWAELTVIAHLTGWDMPRPAPAFTASLRSMQGRLRDCALSHAADGAVAARVPAISARVSPDVLAVHVTAAMRQAIAEGTRACEPEEPQYLAPPYKWALVRDALRPARRSPAAGRHPRSSEWERTYGQLVPGATAKAQLNAVTRWYLRDQRDSQAVAARGHRLTPAAGRHPPTTRAATPMPHPVTTSRATATLTSTPSSPPKTSSPSPARARKPPPAPGTTPTAARTPLWTRAPAALARAS